MSRLRCGSLRRPGPGWQYENGRRIRRPSLTQADSRFTNHDSRLQAYCGVMPAAFTTFADSAICCLTNFANRGGVMMLNSLPSVAAFSRVALSSRARVKSFEILLTIAGGVPPGAHRPNQSA